MRSLQRYKHNNITATTNDEVMNVTSSEGTVLVVPYSSLTQPGDFNYSGRFGTKTNENGQKKDIPVYFITDDDCDNY
jgi:hypothetical protein